MKKIYIILSFLLGILVCTIGHYFLDKKYSPFPHFADKHKYKAILTPQQQLEFYKTMGKYPTFAGPKTLIMVVDKELFKNVLEDYETQQCDGTFSDVYFLTDHPSTAIAKFGLTSPWNAFKLERAIAWGVTQVIFIGTACALQKDIAVGDLFICEKAIRDEGTSYHYLAYSKYVYPSKKMQKLLLNTLEEINKPYKIGTIWTTDAFFRATIEEVTHYQKEGVLGIEMETAGLLSIAVYRNIDMIAMYTRTDSYANLKWEKAANYKKAKMKAMNEFFEIALKVASK